MLIGSLSVALASSAYAHHSHFYDECKSVTVEGQIERVQFKNPHNLIVLRLDDGSAYSVDWLSLTRLGSAGILGAAKGSVVPGARISVTGYLIRDAVELRHVAPKFKGKVDPKTVEARLMRRVDDSFSWGMPRPTAPNCGPQ
jgi:hypothetical protein